MFKHVYSDNENYCRRGIEGCLDWEERERKRYQKVKARREEDLKNGIKKTVKEYLDEERDGNLKGTVKTLGQLYI